MKFKKLFNENISSEFDDDVIQFARMGSGYIEAPMILKFIEWLKKNKTEILNRVKKQKERNADQYDNMHFVINIFNEYSKEKYGKIYRNVKIYSSEEMKIVKTIFKIVWVLQSKWA